MNIQRCLKCVQMHLDTEPGLEPPEELEDVSDGDSDSISNPYDSEYQVGRPSRKFKETWNRLTFNLSILMIMTSRKIAPLPSPWIN